MNRKLEENINQYQNQLRKKIYDGNLELYHQIGRDRLEDFYAEYEFEFQKVSSYSGDI